MRIVLSRRLLLFALLLLLASAMGGALREAERSSGDGATLPTPTPTVATVRATMPDSSEVTARVGDPVEIVVRTSVPERAEIADLGVSVPVDRGLEGPLELTADQPGSFAVTLRYSGEQIGTLEVRDR